VDAYEYAFMREEDERARLDKAEMIGAERKEAEAIVGLYDNNIPIAVIAVSLKISEDRVKSILHKY
jgi:hypothetical protein